MANTDPAPTVTILHISDTQFGEHHRFSDEDSLAANLIRDLRSLTGSDVPPIDLVVVSGDIAETGRKAEYADARAFLDALAAHTGLPLERIIVVPGNHDVSWPLCRAYFAECEDEEIEPVEPYGRKWRHYRDFVNDLHGATAFSEEQPYRLHTYPELRVVVAAMNSTIPETHLPGGHFGRCGDEQLRWFADQLANAKDAVRIGVVHHNARRRAENDDENLRDEDALTGILGPHLDLLLHGHTHEGKQDRLADGTLVLATGSAAVHLDRRPKEVPNQYQILRIRPGGVTRWARMWGGRGKGWLTDPRAGAAGAATAGPVSVPLETAGWDRYPDDGRRRHDRPADAGRPSGAGRPGGDDFVDQVVVTTRLDLGRDTEIEIRHKGDPPLCYLLAARARAPRRCVGVVPGTAGGGDLERFDREVVTPLRGDGAVEAVLVHRGPDDPELRAAAKRQGVYLKTWTEYNSLLDLSAYRSWLRTDLVSDDRYPQPLYQPQRYRPVDRFGVSGARRDDLLAEVYDALLDEDRRFVLILGDAGYGKSFLVRRLAYLLLGNERSPVTPIVVYLRDQDKRQTLDEMVSNVLIDSRSQFHIDRFRHSLTAGTLAILVDGYDEFAVRVGYANAAAQLRTFVDALTGRAKVLLTTRPSHFRSTDQVTTKLFETIGNIHDGRVYQLEPFTEDQQRAFLTRWFELPEHSDPDPGAAADRWLTALGQVDNLPELATTPRMLSFIVEDLTVEEIHVAARHGTVTAADLYQRLIDRWLAEEVGKADHDDARTVSAERRQELLEDLAFTLWQLGERDITEDTLTETARTLDLPALDLTIDQAAQFLGGRTLLRAADRRWRFVHQSLWEYLLARRIADLLRSGRPERLGDAQLTPLTIRFLRDLAPREAAEWASRVAKGRS